MSEQQTRTVYRKIDSPRMTEINYTVLIDDRKKKPLSFPGETEERRLRTGDYCIKGDGIQDGQYFYPNFAVERKGRDWSSSIIWNRDNFENELERARLFIKPMPVIVGRPLRHVRDWTPPDYAPSHPEDPFLQAAENHPKEYHMNYYFVDGRRQLGHLTKAWLESRVVSMSQNDGNGERTNSHGPTPDQWDL